MPMRVPQTEANFRGIAVQRQVRDVYHTVEDPVREYRDADNDDRTLFGVAHHRVAAKLTP
jgi:hypothetical protein